MSRQPLLRLGMVGRAAIGLLGVATALLLAPVAGAQPEVEANDAIAAAWQASGGDAGPLGPPTGDVYPAGEGFAQDFASGRMFFTAQTGAHFMQGAILDKYESLGGAADGDLGFPTIDEGPGLAPGSRNSTFSAPDNPVIFWTPEHGARVVRGPINAAWDELGGSTGALGVPVEDESYDGSVVTQQFAAGQLSYDSQTGTFTTVPPELAEQLTDLSVPDDPVSAINAARRAAGGPLGPLGAAEGEPYEIGDDGLGQDFVNGKIFYSPDTGANVVTGQVLAKYESVGGPQGDLGFPVTNEIDGGLEPTSRMSRFAAADEPVIFWTPDHGAFIVRGPMNAAWQELGGPTGELGAPVADQSQDGDVITQRFNGGSISWDTSTKEFSTDPASLAPQLGGLEVPGQDGQTAAEAPPASNTGDGNGLQWNWWWLLAVVPIILLVALVAFAVVRNRSRGEDPFAATDDDDELYAAAMAGDQHGGERGGEDTLFGDRYAREGLGSLSAVPAPPVPSDDVSAPLSFWSTPVSDEGVDVEQEDPDAVDTAPTRIENPVETELPVLGDYPDTEYSDEAGYRDDFVDEPLEEPVEELSDEPIDEPLVESGDEHWAPPDEGADLEPPAEEAVVGSAAMAEAASDRDALIDTGRHARIDVDEPTPGGTALHMPMGDPREAPGGYPVKADTQSGLYWAPDSPDYDDVAAEVYLASEEMAITMGFVRAY